MRAVAVTAFGREPEVVELPTPDPGPGQVRVRVAAGGLTQVDLRTAREGFWFGGQPRFPLVLGWDCAGWVDAVGPDVVGFAGGDAVVGWSPMALGGPGLLAEQVVLSAGNVAAAPGLGAADATCLPLNGMTAWQVLDLARVGPGTDVLVLGGVGQLGGFVVELASTRGASVLSSVRADQADQARALGAVRVVDRAGDLRAQVAEALAGTGAQVVVNTAGAAAREAALGAVAAGGTYVSVVPEEGPVPDGVHWEQALVTMRTDQLVALPHLARRGLLTPRVGSVHELDDVAGAVLAVEQPGTIGKVVLAL